MRHLESSSALVARMSHSSEYNHESSLRTPGSRDSCGTCSPTCSPSRTLALRAMGAWDSRNPSLRTGHLSSGNQTGAGPSPGKSQAGSMAAWGTAEPAMLSHGTSAKAPEEGVRACSSCGTAHRSPSLPLELDVFFLPRPQHQWWRRRGEMELHSSIFWVSAITNNESDPKWNRLPVEEGRQGKQLLTDIWTRQSQGKSTVECPRDLSWSLYCSSF
uniref:Uncharacterized protein LOC110201652 isoform X2 n=1 Tax=Phascolarctos cinereus TaxID=38626 RepID=A0A6P5JPJ2_PHACI|nr:uncharacterized protein LOC110201652 isoform X2 [Phascolarctos cinereus]